MFAGKWFTSNARVSVAGSSCAVTTAATPSTPGASVSQTIKCNAPAASAPDATADLKSTGDKLVKVDIPSGGATPYASSQELVTGTAKVAYGE